MLLIRFEGQEANTIQQLPEGTNSGDQIPFAVAKAILSGREIHRCCHGKDEKNGLSGVNMIMDKLDSCAVAAQKLLNGERNLRKAIEVYMSNRSGYT